MKIIHPSLALGFGLAAALAAPALAQVAEPVVSSGLLGKRYVEASFIITDTQNITDTGYGLGTAINVPLTAKLDVGAFFTHNWSENSSSNDFQDLAAYVTAYGVCGDFRPYATATLGYQWWQHVSNDPWYQVDVGSEYLVTQRLSLSAQLSWSEFLSSDWDGGEWGARVRANYWVTTNLAASTAVAYTEGGTWTYTLGVVYRF